VLPVLLVQLVLLAQQAELALLVILVLLAQQAELVLPA
jgi:hypothetical protein